MTGDATYAVSIESVGDGWEGHQGELQQLAEAFVTRPELGAAVGWGGLSGGPGITMTVAAPSPVEAGRRALEIFEKALAEAGVGPAEVARLDVMTEAYQDADLDRPPREYAGLSEVAKILGVSKQRVSELRRRRDFPHPVAELAAGPVWDRTSLNHFIAGWARKPGRPPSVKGSELPVVTPERTSPTPGR
jgi:hypothetical protein